MKKTRKQTALAKCVLATIMAMGMMGYTTVWADTPTPSPVDKTVSKDAAGQIYDASHNYHQGYFWTDLGHAQVQIGSGEQIELFTPFIYHTNNVQWKKGGAGWNPVHEGDNSEMECKESMSRITVGEFDRIIKSLYTNDITMAKTIYGEAGQAGLKDTVIKAVRATPGQGKTVNTYELVRANDDAVAAAIVDTDTKITANKLTFADGTLTSKITDNAGGVYTDSVGGIASQGWVNNKLESIVDTNTTNTGMEGSLDEYGKLTVKVKDSDQRSVQAEVEGIASRSWVTNQLEGIAGTDTVTTAESGHEIITVVDANKDLPTDNKHHVIGINEDALRGFIQETAAAQDTNTTNTIMEGNLDGDGKLTLKVNDSYGKSVDTVVEDVASRSWVTNQLENVVDTNTVTTVATATNLLEITDEGVDGNHAYKIDINSDQLGDFVQQYDTNTITTAESVHNIITVNNSMEGQENGKNYQIGINEDALKGFIQENIQDTNTITTVADDGKGYVGVTDAMDADGNHNYTVAFDEGKLINTIKENDTNTVTMVADDGKGYVGVTDAMDADGNHNYTVAFDEGKLINTIKENDTNTITTVADDGKGYVAVTDAMDADGNYNYTVAFDENKLIQTIEDQDRYVNGGSIGEDGSITLNVHNGRDVTLEGQMKDARLTDIERDKEAGTATLVVKDRYNPEEVNRLTIDDIASKAQNDRDHAEFREHFNELDHRVDNLGSRVDKVGAGAAALAALHPMDFDPDDKLTFAAGYGNYKGKNAAAVGAFYRPDEKVMLSVGGTFGNGENMVNAGISFSLDRTARVSNSRTAMAKEIVDLRANVANLTALVGQLTAGMGGTIEMDRMKLFPDVPENHWAYEYIGRLAAAGIVEGYPDGMFNGNRMMSRYEFAAMLYRALEKGVKLDHKLVREFEPEMGRIHVARISGADGDRGKIERVRVYGGDNRDHYGSKLK